MVFGLWKRRADETPYTLYQNVVNQARTPHFYQQWGVSDTMSGRFDMLIAHAILVFRRLKRIDGAREEEASARSQGFSDLMFKDLDRALRDTGLSDRKVPKRLKMLATAYLGRGQAFGEALDADDMNALVAAIERNAEGITFDVDGKHSGDEPADRSLNSAALAAYLRTADQHLMAQDDDAILAGHPHWPSPVTQAGV